MEAAQNVEIVGRRQTQEAQAVMHDPAGENSLQMIPIELAPEHLAGEILGRGGVDHPVPAKAVVDGEHLAEDNRAQPVGQHGDDHHVLGGEAFHGGPVR